MKIITEGLWCNNCEFLEDGEDMEPTKCAACGCLPSDHISVKVVTE